MGFVVALFYKVAIAMRKGAWLCLFWAALAGAAELTPWDGTEATVKTLPEGAHTITLNTAESREYVLTTNGEEVEASLSVVVKEPSAVVTIRLRNVCLKASEVVLQSKGSGTLRVISEEGVSVLRRVGAAAGEIVGGGDAGTLVLGGTKGASLWVFAQGAGSNAMEAISATTGTVRIESGELHVMAAGAGKATAKEKRVPAAIVAKEIVVTGGEVSVGVFFTVKESVFTAADMEGAWPSPLFAMEGVSFLGGVLKAEPKARKTPSGTFAGVSYPTSPITAQTVVNAMGASAYVYPDEAFAEVQDVALGGQVGNKAFLRFQAEDGASEKVLKACVVNGETEVASEAMEVDFERNVVIVDAKRYSTPRFKFGDKESAGAATLFGCVPTATAEGVRVDYAFGLSWIGLGRKDGEASPCVAVRASVRLPQETAPQKKFMLTVFRKQADVETEVFKGVVPFLRCSPTDNLYETAPILTLDTFSDEGIGTRRYRVEASEAR